MNTIPISKTNLTGDRVRDLVAALLRLDQDARVEVEFVSTIDFNPNQYVLGQRRLLIDEFRQCRECERQAEEGAFLQAELDAGNDAIQELYKIRNALP